MISLIIYLQCLSVTQDLQDGTCTRQYRDEGNQDVGLPSEGMGGLLVD